MPPFLLSAAKPPARLRRRSCGWHFKHRREGERQRGVRRLIWSWRQNLVPHTEPLTGRRTSVLKAKRAHYKRVWVFLGSTGSDCLLTRWNYNNRPNRHGRNPQTLWSDMLLLKTGTNVAPSQRFLFCWWETNRHLFRASCGFRRLKCLKEKQRRERVTSCCFTAALSLEKKNSVISHEQSVWA